MKLEWDPAKAKSNLRKHGVDFADAVAVFEDEDALTIEDESSEGERRWVTMGGDGLGRVVVAVYTWRGDVSVSFRAVRLRHVNGGNTRECDET